MLLLAACTSTPAGDSVARDVTTATEPSTGSSWEPAPDGTTETSGQLPTVPTESPSLPAPALPDPLTPTPAQTEGPFYPVEKPADRDNDLLVVDGGTERPAGTPLELVGLLVDRVGQPVEGATVEIWQVDNEGIYDHPGDRATDDRDRRFQFYGESVTDPTGMWHFLTILPVPYEPRPAHIHMKVIVGDQEVLTTQVYFAGDPLVDGDRPAAEAGDDLGLLTVVPVPATLSNGIDGVLATHVIVLADD